MKSIFDLLTFAGGFTKLLSSCLLIVLVSASRLLGQWSVLLDPGHGDHDPGAIGACPLQEKDFNLDISNKAYDLIQGQLGGDWSVYTTRHTDVFLDRPRRAEIANNVSGMERDSHNNEIPGDGVTIFVSIHANGHANPTADGTEVYYYEGPPQHFQSEKIKKYCSPKLAASYRRYASSLF